MTLTRKIAFEEHFSAVGFDDYSKAFVKHINTQASGELNARLADFDDTRIRLMDQYAIDYVILSQTGPGVQNEPDTATAVRRSRQNNDFLAAQIDRNRERFGGFATLPMQDPDAAIEELRRTVNDLGFKGALVNGHTHGIYYDDRQYDPFWAELEKLGVPLYLHPFDAYDVPHAYSGHPELVGATWGWGVEAGTHALRLLFGGVFDRFPGVKVILGHMGEGLPFQRWRFDSRFAVYPHGVSLKQQPSQYIGSNILITTSGVCSHAALQGAIAEMGPQAVMFSVDYPYESIELAANFIDTAPLDERTKNMVCYENAKKLFNL